MTNRSKSGEGPGQFEDQERCLSVSVDADGAISFVGDNTHPQAGIRAHRLVSLLEWFQVAVTPSSRIASPARTEPFTLSDLALYVWDVCRVPGERPIDQQSDAEFRKFLGGFDMLPGWLRKPGFLRNANFLSYVKSQNALTRSIGMEGFEEASVIRRLQRAGLSERMVRRDVHLEEIRQISFPVRMQPSSAEADPAGHFAYLRDSLAAMDRPISLADVEELLLNRMSKEPGWYRQYIT